ncbi:hypothetical protein BDZ94DRAFT_1268376 [Collybia nuda]|uniref:FAD-binding PCMH-type domain-containing protein n=1 Tax=Collybia nuda TaxID=64659 RepID=A0A9P6CBF1_9AGAR|nr:hypothetical protein BDZ94DRAFT_1268376 [Collybia nuda]
MASPSTAALKLDLKGEAIDQGGPGYAEAIARWAINAERKAAIVAFVKDTADITAAIKHARKHKLQIAIRGGGHSAAGASSVEGGLVIDLSRYMNGVKIDTGKNLAYVGGGALWETVDKTAIEHGLATVGGTVNHTGVGGLTLGGGYGYLSGSHGLVIDNLVQATVVTADGSVLTASEKENPDLFFGIRGGGSNFGVIAEFVLQLHPQRRTVYAGFIIFPPTALEKVISATAEWYSKASEKEGMLQFTTVGPDGNPAVVLAVFYNGSEAEGREAYKIFYDIGPVADTTAEVPYEQVNGLQNERTKHGSCVYLKGLAHRKPHFPSISKVFDKVIDMAKNTQIQATIIYEYFPLGKIRSIPNGTTAFRRDPTNAVLISITWEKNLVENNEKARAFAHEFAAIISGGQTEVSASEGLGYSNYDPGAAVGEKDGVPDKAKLVFVENYPKLQQIKKRYDPENMFNKWFPITPA